MSVAIETFIDILERGPLETYCVFNPWRDHDERDGAPRREMPARRRENMAAYLEARASHARVMLLGVRTISSSAMPSRGVKSVMLLPETHTTRSGISLTGARSLTFVPPTRRCVREIRRARCARRDR